MDGVDGVDGVDGIDGLRDRSVYAVYAVYGSCKTSLNFAPKPRFGTCLRSFLAHLSATSVRHGRNYRMISTCCAVQADTVSACNLG